MATPQTGPPVATNALGLGSDSFLLFMLLTTVRTWRDMTMDCSMLCSQVKLLPFSSWRRPKRKATFGILHGLPKEMIFAIFENTSLDALMNLRQTNSYAKHIVESWLPFRRLVVYGPQILRAAIAIKSSKFLTVTRLLAATFGDRCRLCGEFGAYIQLVKCVRCCFHCLSNDRRLHCINYSMLSGLLNPKMSDRTGRARGMKILRTALERVPRVLTIPQPSFWGRRISERCWAFDYNAALHLFKPLKPTLYLPSILQRRIAQGKGRPCYYEIPPLTGRIHPRDGYQLRYLTAIHQCAMIKTKSGKIVSSGEGMLCTGCKIFWGLHSQGRHHAEHSIYNSWEIGRHLANCPYAKLAWNLVVKLTTRSPLTGRVLIPMVILLIQHQGVPRRRSVEFGEMPWEFNAFFKLEYQMKKRLSYGDRLIEETQANWAVARRCGSSDMCRYLAAD